MKNRKLARSAWICLGLALITLAVFSPTLSHEFLDYDDQQYVTENARVRAGLTGQGFFWAFKTFHASNWHPLTWLSHMADCQLFDLHPAGHHLTSVLLHVANTLLLFVVLRRLTGSQWRSASLAALFAWHPLHVESVAWIAERKDVLCAFFWLLTIWAYAAFAESKAHSPQFPARNPRHWCALALVFFALGLMSKPMAVTLPFVLLLLDYWPLGRMRGIAESQVPGPELTARDCRLPGLIFEKLPFFVLSGAACILTVLAQQQSHAVVSQAGLPISERVGHALLAYVHYVGAMFLPRRLAVYYPYQTGTSTITLVLTGTFLALLSVLAFRLRSRRPYLLVGWLWFFGTLVPVIGLVQVGDQSWADRYTYLPLIGLFLAVVWGGADLYQSVAARLAASQATLPPEGAATSECAGPGRSSAGNQASSETLPRATLADKVAPGAGALRLLPGFLCAIVAVALLTATSLQLRFWKNTRTLFEHAAQVTPNNPLAITLLGSLLAREGKIDQAIEHYRTALRYKPGYPEAHFFLGNALDQQGKLDEAIAEYKQALWFKPTQTQTHISLGVALAKQNKYDEAAAQYLLALKLEPEAAVAHNNLARILQTQGKLDEAIEHYFAALKLDPRLPQAHNNLGVLLLQKGRVVEGVAHLREALRLNPGDAGSEYNLALGLNQSEQWAEAAGLLGAFVSARPEAANAYYQLGLALEHQAKTREAVGHYARTLLLKQDFPEALNRLAWILATDSRPEFRNGPESLTMAQRACELTQNRQATFLATLAAAYAENGKFKDAILAAQTARDLAAKNAQPELTKKCDAMLEAFRKGEPWRERRE